ncbi:PAS domain-containing protein [Thioclava sp. BHET1]|nr:PAS domain-containing protein [Thioclava sp. BHET1]
MASVWFEAGFVALTSVGSAILAMLVTWWLIGRARVPDLAEVQHPELEQTVFLFDDHALVDATAPARALIEATPAGASDWSRLAGFIGPRFHDFPAQMAGLVERGRIHLVGTQREGGRRPLELIAENIDGLARITLCDPEAEGRGVLVDGLSQRALEDELEVMRQTIDRSPALVWRADQTGAISWANRAYILRSGVLETSEDGFIWPLPVLFNFDPNQARNGPIRVALTGAEAATSWYDCHSFELHGSWLHFALPANAVVRAEQALRDFVQTLSKTFADLPVGLAVFDRQRQLQLFNPALIDLLQLPPEMMTARPTLYAFLDRLRETRMMPEPKDYRSWRTRMTELEKAASTGLHSETWGLPGGQTYRVTGRPHPDGAVAFLFEDISAEIASTRRFRAQLEVSQEVLDRVDDAIAVFQSDGELMSSNVAYCRMWSVDPEAVLGRMSLVDAIGHWREGCQPTPFWSTLKTRAQKIGARDPVSEVVRLKDGTRLQCRLNPLHGGALMVQFSHQPEPRAVLGGKSRRQTNAAAHG